MYPSIYLSIYLCIYMNIFFLLCSWKQVTSRGVRIFFTFRHQSEMMLHVAQTYLTHYMNTAVKLIVRWIHYEKKPPAAGGRIRDMFWALWLTGNHNIVAIAIVYVVACSYTVYRQSQTASQVWTFHRHFKRSSTQL
jgi:hypothetical protein